VSTSTTDSLSATGTGRRLPLSSGSPNPGRGHQEVDLDPLRDQGFDFFVTGRHFAPGAPVVDRDRLSSSAQCGARRVDGRIAAADDRNTPAHRHRLSEVNLAQELDTPEHSAGVIIGQRRRHRIMRSGG